MRADDDSTIDMQLQRLFDMCDLLSSQVNNSRANGQTRHALGVIKNHASDSLREVLRGYGEMLGRLNLTSAVDNIFEPRVNYCDKHISKIQPMAFLGIISAYTMINSTVLAVPPKPVFDHVRTTQLALFLFVVKRLKVEFDKDGANAYSYMRRQYGVQPNKAGLIQAATILTRFYSGDPDFSLKTIIGHSPSSTDIDEMLAQNVPLTSLDSVTALVDNHIRLSTPLFEQLQRFNGQVPKFFISQSCIRFKSKSHKVSAKKA